MVSSFSIVATLAILSSTAATTCSVTNCAALSAAYEKALPVTTPFEIRDATVLVTGLHPVDNTPVIRLLDTSGPSPAIYKSHLCGQEILCAAGDRISIRGYIHLEGTSSDCRYTVLEILRHGAPPLPRALSGTDFLDHTNDYHLVKLTGIVSDVFNDDIDPHFFYATLHCQGEPIYSAFSTNILSQSNCTALIGTRMTTVGLCLPRLSRTRRFIGRVNSVTGILAMNTGGDIPIRDISALDLSSPLEVTKVGPHSASGTVLAVWHAGTKVLLKTSGNAFLLSDLVSRQPPSVGDTIRLIGKPLSNGYHINLARSTWSMIAPANSGICGTGDVVSASANQILGKSDSRIHPEYHGCVIRLTGRIGKVVTDGDSNTKTLYLENGDFLVPVDLYACHERADELSEATRISATGVCVMDIENWSPATVFPRIRGFTLVPRGDGDIQILEKPSWLTIGKLMIISAILIALLVGAMVWNTSLRILVARRSRELLRAQIGKISTELRVKERTRIAVELHDSLAQNLTGVSMELEAAERSREDGLDALSKHLSIADKALKSCRVELRNSLWDLRSRALEASNVNDAIRQTLVPHVKNVKLIVRFNVPRTRFSDNTLHEVLRIIRELTINGIRHGEANEIRIAGAIESNRLLFSVQDNGCGFDPDDCPGVMDGHFGLQGIGERLDNFSGSLRFTRIPGKGMKATVTIPLPGNSTKEPTHG